jgi:hypothetical protein
MGALWARRTLVPVPCLTSPFIVALRERGSTAIHDRYLRSGCVSDQKTNAEIRPKDHIPNTSGSNPRCTYMWPRPGGLVSRHGDVTDHGNPHNHHHAPPSMVQCSRTSRAASRSCQRSRAGTGALPNADRSPPLSGYATPRLCSSPPTSGIESLAILGHARTARIQLRESDRSMHACLRTTTTAHARAVGACSFPSLSAPVTSHATRPDPTRPDPGRWTDRRTKAANHVLLRPVRAAFFIVDGTG